MKIKDSKGLLKGNSLDNMVDSLLEELDQVADGPDLDPGKELENVATEERDANTDTLEKVNTDVYPSDEHDQVEDVEGIVVESEQTAAGPDLEPAKELENEATEEREAEEDTLEKDNADTYPSDEHDQAEDVEGIVVESEQTAAGPDLEPAKELENEATEEREAEEDTLEKDNADTYPSDEHDQTEDVEGIVVESKISRLKRKETKLLKTQKKVDDKLTKVQGKLDKKLNKYVEKYKPESTAVVTEAFSDSDLMEILKENNYKATAKNLKILKEGLASGEYEIVVEDNLETNPVVADAIDAGVASEVDAPVGETVDEIDELLDDQPAETPDDSQVDDVADNEAVSDEIELTESMKNIISLINTINEELESQTAAGPDLEPTKELENEATEEREAEEDTLEKDNADTYPSDEHDQVEDVEGIVVESEQTAVGPDLEPTKELENEATEEREPTGAEPTTTNTDLYCDVTHKQAEDVVEVVVEAARALKKAGKAVSMHALTEAVRIKLMEEEGKAPNVGDPSEKEYDVDADIESAEANGSETAFEKYDDIQGEGAEAAKGEGEQVEPSDIQESVKYTSLREACMLDESYFQSDSYTINTAEEKVTTLTEQISLLMAREANDPVYNELIKTSMYAQRLEEQLMSKYGKEAAKRSEAICKK